jgi:hypothetical protein
MQVDSGTSSFPTQHPISPVKTILKSARNIFGLFRQYYATRFPNHDPAEKVTPDDLIDYESPLGARSLMRHKGNAKRAGKRRSVHVMVNSHAFVATTFSTAALFSIDISSFGLNMLQPFSMIKP